MSNFLRPPWTAAHLFSLFIIYSQNLLKLMSIESVMPSNNLILCRPFLLLPSIFPNIKESVLCIRYQIIGVSASESVLPMIFRTDCLQEGLVGSPCSPRDSQEYSLTPQFRSINSSLLSFLYSPTLTSIHDHWKNHSFD